jgi:hypothetical protein
MTYGRQSTRQRGICPTEHEKKEQAMKLTIFAATGGIGRHILEQAVAAGHDVTAVVRTPKNGRWT